MCAKGPFPIERVSSLENEGRVRFVGNAGAVSVKENNALIDEEAPDRNYDCKNYDTCLGLAAALNWKSFVCAGCCGEVNKKLLWRAHHEVKLNPALAKLCGLPVLGTKSF